MALWTFEEDEIIRYMAADGKSAGQIAAVMRGRSRNAVIGRLDRLGIRLRGHESKVAVAKRATTVNKIKRERAKRIITPPVVLVENRRDRVGVSFTQINNYQCRGVLRGEGASLVYCGLSVERVGDYCDECAGLYYRKSGEVK